MERRAAARAKGEPVFYVAHIKQYECVRFCDKRMFGGKKGDLHPKCLGDARSPLISWKQQTHGAVSVLC